MATLKDIARHLDLSITQVSRALNDHSDVNEQTRIRVKRAARDMNYQPNMLARKLVSGRSGIVALVVPESPVLADDGLFIEVVAGLSSQFSERGMQFLLHIMQPDEPVLDVYQSLIGKGALDGFVLLDPLDDDPRIAFLQRRGTVFVLHGRTQTKPSYPFFDIENEKLTYETTEYLVNRGHRSIAMIAGNFGRSFVTSRVRGYKAALLDHGGIVQPALIHHGDMNEAHGLISTINLLSGNGPRPSAIICGNVRIAKGVFEALQALGLSVPGDISVIAHDDHLPNLRPSAFYPALTVTKAPLRDSWKPLVDCLAGAIAGLPLPELQRLGDYEMIERESVATVSQV